MVYTVMEAAFEFNDIVTKLLAFDATKYGVCARTSFSNTHERYLLCCLGALAWSIVSFGMNVSITRTPHPLEHNSE